MDLLEVFGPVGSTMRTGLRMNWENCDIVFNEARMERIMRRRGSFDVVLVHTMGSECVTRVASALQLPMIYAIASTMLTYMERKALGDLSNPAVVSHVMAPHAVPATFGQRFGNAALTLYTALLTHYLDSTHLTVPPVQPSAVFLNTHYSVEPARPFPPNVFQVGGIHLKPAKKIPKDILEFIENSPHGVIYFTFGSMAAMSTLPEHILNAFKDALSQVPQRVLWKYEGEMKDKPKNVMTSKWLPQRDILLHQNVRLFISHGGISGTFEAIDSGVPVLGFPLFFDQPRNIDSLVHIGMAISMELSTVTRTAVLNNILELINNEKYTKNAKLARQRFKDRPMSPAQSVVYWTEYIVRHKGAPHLIYHATNLTWYQYFMLDAIAVVLIIIFRRNIVGL